MRRRITKLKEAVAGLFYSRKNKEIVERDKWIEYFRIAAEGRKDQVDELRQTVANLRQEVTSRNKQIAECDKEIAKRDRRIEDLYEALYDVAETIDRARKVMRS